MGYVSIHSTETPDTRPHGIIRDVSVDLKLDCLKAEINSQYNADIVWLSKGEQPIRMVKIIFHNSVEAKRAAEQGSIFPPLNRNYQI